MVSIPMTGARISSDSQREGDLPGSLLSAYHISYKGLLVVAMMMLVPGSDPTSWDGEVNGATSNLKYCLANVIN